ncbi:hypothetical protein AAFF_G00011590 [Aldrovandia affinis]|uniref:Uncharacterized protein n=1 Tax=Aldrovandia affinis TaxID=143900 RepID=A0AAD7VYL5_9TELE|nr:hypothetical protein AAFF_G00011590 [Aldrovandia affinis]
MTQNIPPSYVRTTLEEKKKTVPCRRGHTFGEELGRQIRRSNEGRGFPRTGRTGALFPRDPAVQPTGLRA